MFSKNNLISSKQIFKMYFSSSAASSLLLLLYDYSSVYEGIYTIISTYIFSLLCLTVYSKYLRKHQNSSNKRQGKRSHIIFNKLFNIILSLKYSFILFITLYLLGYSTSHILSISSRNMLYLVALILLVIYREKSTTEQMARFSELTFYIMLIPLIIIVATTITKVSPSLLVDSFHYTKCNDFSIIRVMVMAFIFGKILFPVEILKSMNNHLSKNYDDNIDTVKKAMLLSLSFTTATTLIIYTIIVGIFGNVSATYTIHPFFSLMQMISINTTLEGRLESIVCICIFTSLIYSSSYYLRNLRISLGKGLTKKLPVYVIFIPLALLAGYIVTNTDIQKSNISPEERLVVKNIYIHEDGLLYIEVFDIEDDSKLYETNLTSLNDVENSFIDEYNLYLDFSHTNNIIVANNIFQNTSLLKELLYNYKRDLRFPENLTVVNLDSNNAKIPLYKLYIE